EVGERPVALLDCALVLLGGEAEDVLELLEHLALEEVGFGEVDEGVEERDALLGEEVAFLDEGGFHGFRRGGDGGTRATGLYGGQRAREAVDHREEDDVE